MRATTLLAGLITLSVGAGPTAALASSPSQNGSASVAVVPPMAKGGMTKAPDLEQMMAFFDKLFPPLPDPDPARLALARSSVMPMWPDGAYSKMMTGFMGGMFDRFMALKKSDFAKLDPSAANPGAANPGAGAGTKDLSMHEKLAAKDPQFDQRMAAIRGVITEELGKLSAIVDPRIREGLARSMARRFDAQQLTDINAFFATPSGHALATHFMQLWVDPDTLRSLVGAMPEMMKLMPDAMQKMKAVNDRFPKPPPSTKDTKPAKP